MFLCKMLIGQFFQLGRIARTNYGENAISFKLANFGGITYLTPDCLMTVKYGNWFGYTTNENKVVSDIRI